MDALGDRRRLVKRNLPRASRAPRVFACKSATDGVLLRLACCGTWLAKDRISRDLKFDWDLLTRGNVNVARVVETRRSAGSQAGVNVDRFSKDLRNMEGR